MKDIYHLLSNFFLLIPIISIIGGFTLNKFVKIQKIVNDISYVSFAIATFVLLFLCNNYGEYEFTLFNISINNPISFTINNFNLTFCAIFSACIVFLNYNFQNSFAFLKLFSKYALYNKQIGFLLFFSILLIFSNNVIFSTFIYIFILFASISLLTNPELKELRKGYSTTFLVGLISSLVLVMVFSYYFFSSNNLLFVAQDIKSLSFNSVYFAVACLALLCLGVFCLPVYLFFKEKLYYEDFLPAFIIYFFPFVFLNTFLFIKIIHYFFSDDFSNLGLYFYYIGFVLVGLFVFSVVNAFIEVKNGLKFTILFNLSNFLIFLSQVLFVNSDMELIKALSNFMVLIVAIFCNIFAYSGILFLFLNSNMNSGYFLFKHSKSELNFYLITLFVPLLLNIMSFMELNFYNFNILYFLNIIELATLFVLFFIFLYVFLFRKPASKNIPEMQVIKDIDMLKFFIASLSMLLVLLVTVYFKSEIMKIILEK